MTYEDSGLGAGTTRSYQVAVLGNGAVAGYSNVAGATPAAGITAVVTEIEVAIERVLSPPGLRPPSPRVTMW